MFKACILEPWSVVNLFVESHYGCHIMLAEIAEVSLGGMECVSILDLALGMRSAESEVFTWHDPIEVAILHFLRGDEK